MSHHPSREAVLAGVLARIEAAGGEAVETVEVTPKRGGLRKRDVNVLIERGHPIEWVVPDQSARWAGPAKTRRDAKAERIMRLLTMTERLRAALVKHGRHDATCAHLNPHREPCTCGLDAAVEMKEDEHEMAAEHDNRP